MNIGARLEAIAALVPQNCVVADIGTDGMAYAERLN